MNTHCERRTPDGHCFHFVETDGRPSEFTLCLDSHISQEYCPLEKAVNDAVRGPDFEQERRGLKGAKTDADREVIFGGIRGKVLRRVTGGFARRVIAEAISPETYLREVPRYFRTKRRFWGDKEGCALLASWNPSDCIDPTTPCFQCSLARAYHERIAREKYTGADGREYFRRHFGYPQDDALRLEVAEKFFSRQS